MVRITCENSESIAFYGGEEIENNIFKAKFAHIFNNFRALMRYQKINGLLTVMVNWQLFFRCCWAHHDIYSGKNSIRWFV